MKLDLKEELKIPEGVTVSVLKGVFNIKGSKGELQKHLHNPAIISKVEANKIIFEVKKTTQRQKKLVKSYLAHLKNMMRGVNQPHIYKLKICSGHFPMSVSLKGKVLEIKNFIGETVPRTVKIPEETNVVVEGQNIVVEGIDKEKTSQVAALIEQITSRPGYDKRIFQDGIFIIEKDGKPIK